MPEFVDAIRAALTGPDAAIYLAGGAGLLLVALMVPLLLVRRVDPMDRIARERSRRRSTPRARAGRCRGTARATSTSRSTAQYLDIKDEEELSKIRTMLIRAGYPHKDAVRTLVAAQIVLGLGLVAWAGSTRSRWSATCPSRRRSDTR